jgi:hypothetical protein
MYTGASVSAGLNIANTTVANTTIPAASSFAQKSLEWGIGKLLFKGSYYAAKGTGWGVKLLGKASLGAAQWGVVEGTKFLWNGATPFIQDGIRHVEGNETAIAFDAWSKMVENRTMRLYEPYTNLTDIIANKTGTMLLNVDQAVTNKIMDGQIVSGFSASELIGPVALTTWSGLTGVDALLNAWDHSKKIVRPEGVTIEETTKIEREAPRFAGEGNHLKPAAAAVVLDKISADVNIEENNLKTRVKHLVLAGLYTGYAYGCGHVAYLTGKEIVNRLAEVGGNITTVAVIVGTAYCATKAFSLMMKSDVKPKPKRPHKFERVTVEEIKIPKASEGDAPPAKAA